MSDRNRHNPHMLNNTIDSVHGRMRVHEQVPVLYPGSRKNLAKIVHLRCQQKQPLALYVSCESGRGFDVFESLLNKWDCSVKANFVPPTIADVIIIYGTCPADIRLDAFSKKTYLEHFEGELDPQARDWALQLCGLIQMELPQGQTNLDLSWYTYHP